MKPLTVLYDLPELQEIPASERIRVIRQWQREVDQPWSGYLLHCAFGLGLSIPIIFASVLFTPSSIYDRYHVGLLTFAILVGVMGGNALHNRFVVLRRRDILHRLLEQRRPTL